MQAQTAVSLVALVAELAHNNAFHSILSNSFPDIVDCRNMYLSLWYDKLVDSSHMLFVDHDMQFEPQLIVEMLKADKPLIGCLYPHKRLPISWVGSALSSNPLPENGLLELEGVGCGVMLIRRDCVEKILAQGLCPVQNDKDKTGLLHMFDSPMKRIIHAFDKVIDEKGRHLSEDFSFCWRHRKSGGKVYAAIDHAITHIGPQQFTAKYSDVYTTCKRIV